MNAFAIVANEPSGLVAFKVGFGGCAAPRPFFASATNAVINQDERVPNGAPVLDAFFSEHKENFISRRALPIPRPPTRHRRIHRSEARRVGKECVSKCRSRVSP